MAVVDPGHPGKKPAGWVLAPMRRPLFAAGNKRLLAARKAIFPTGF
jgi:hypothetical protein